VAVGQEVNMSTRHTPRPLRCGEGGFVGGEKALLLCVGLAVLLTAGQLVRRGSDKAASDAARVLRTQDGQVARLGTVVPGPATAQPQPVKAGPPPPTMLRALGFAPEAPAAQAEPGALSTTVMDRAAAIGAEINATGGYRFDGYNDCYGFVRRVWDPVLAERGLGPLPVADGPSSPDWMPISSWDDLRPGDVLSTHQGHMWGDTWHGGLYAGKDDNGVHYIHDSSSGRNGAYLRPLPSSGFFGYVYRPTHEMLSQ
jgi:hypothetical protein